VTGSDINLLEAVLRERLAGTLPGLQAQRRFMPTPPRAGWKPGEFPSDARLAAGLLLIYPGERGASIVLTVRASGLRRHAGQVSLPGGATDPGETLAQAALREAHEEIGIDPARVRVLGELTPVHVLVSGFTLHPIVAITDERPAFTLAAHEVEEVLELSVTDLQDASTIRYGVRTREGVATEYPYFDVHGHQVWGATAMILGELLCIISPPAELD
jgi:8-oxo-dGTP pyrophosphatase MutT (NUDIX family)